MLIVVKNILSLTKKMILTQLNKKFFFGTKQEVHYRYTVLLIPRKHDHNHIITKGKKIKLLPFTINVGQYVVETCYQGFLFLVKTCNQVYFIKIISLL